MRVAATRVKPECQGGINTRSGVGAARCERGESGHGEYSMKDEERELDEDLARAATAVPLM